jgi:hypothetical protein
VAVRTGASGGLSGLASGMLSPAVTPFFDRVVGEC